MSNVYRISRKEMCEHCLDKDQRIHELEMHDQDESDLTAYAWALMMKLVWLGIMLCIIGGGAAMLGLWALDNFGSGYGHILGVTIWIFGVYVLFNAVIITARYHTDKKFLKGHLEALRGMRRQEIRERNNERLEESRKKKEKNNAG